MNKNLKILISLIVLLIGLTISYLLACTPWQFLNLLIFGIMAVFSGITFMATLFYGEDI